MNSKRIKERALELAMELQNASMDDLWEAVHSIEADASLTNRTSAELARRDALVILEELANDRQLNARFRDAFARRCGC